MILIIEINRLFEVVFDIPKLRSLVAIKLELQSFKPFVIFTVLPLNLVEPHIFEFVVLPFLEFLQSRVIFPLDLLVIEEFYEVLFWQREPLEEALSIKITLQESLEQLLDLTRQVILKVVLDDVSFVILGFGLLDDALAHLLQIIHVIITHRLNLLG